MTIDSSGKVGIGTDSPYTPLEVSATDPVIRLNVKSGVTDKSNYEIRGIGASGFEGIQFRTVNDANSVYASLMMIEQGGNVGIGTDSPVRNISVFGSSSAVMSFHNSTTGTTISDGMFIGNDANLAYVFNYEATPLIFATSAIERMRISSVGDILCTSDGGTDAFRVFNASTGAGDIYLRVEKAYSSAAVARSAGIILGSNAGNLGSTWTVETNSSNGYFGSGNLDFIHNAGGTPSTRMRITSGGNVAIGGTLGADSQFRVELKPAGTILAGLRIGYANTSQNYYDANEHFFRNGIGSNSSLVFIDSNQNLLVGGTTLPAAASGAYVALRGGDNNCIETRRIGTGGRSHHIFYNGNGIVGNIETSGSTTSYNETSDYRLKEDLQDFAGLDMVSKIPVYDFKWKVDESRSYGVMAHELAEVLPQSVSGEKDSLNEDGSMKPQGVDYSKIVPLLVKSIQELKADNDILKSRIETLENK